MFEQKVDVTVSESQDVTVSDGSWNSGSQW